MTSWSKYDKYSTAKYTIITLVSYIIGFYYFGVSVSEKKVNFEEVRSDVGETAAGTKKKKKLRIVQFSGGTEEETAAKWLCFLLLCMFLIPHNKLNSAELKGTEEGNDWPQKKLLSPYLTINRSWQTVYQHSTKCHIMLLQRVWWTTECKQTDCFHF